MLGLYDYCSQLLIVPSRENALLDHSRVDIRKCDSSPEQGITTVKLLLMWDEFLMCKTSQQGKGMQENTISP